MATNRLAVGTGYLLGNEFTLTEPTAVFLSTGGSKPAPEACIEIWVKASTGLFNYFADLSGGQPSGVLPAGTYKAIRVKGTVGLEQV